MQRTASQRERQEAACALFLHVDNANSKRRERDACALFPSAKTDIVLERVLEAQAIWVSTFRFLHFDCISVSHTGINSRQTFAQNVG